VSTPSRSAFREVTRMSERFLVAACAVVFVVLLLGDTSVAARQATPASEASATDAEETSSPARCVIGIAMTSMHNPDLANDAFQADFWIWSVCPDGRYRPLETIEFMNANSVNMSLEGEAVVDGLYWDYAKVSGTFQHRWNLVDFPFDRQDLTIVMEESTEYADIFRYEADSPDLIPLPDVRLDEWRFVGSDLEATTATYLTTYGDPSQPDGTSEYALLVATVSLERNDLMGFIKLTFVVYIAFLISLISYFLHMNNPTMLAARMSVISGTLFAVAVSMRTATSALSTEERLTLVDKIHITALVAIFVDASAALASYLLLERGRPEAEVKRFNHIMMIVVVVGFVVTNVGLISSAAIR
jgi:hypothetical protein